VNRAEKAESINELKDCFQRAKGVFVADYRGLSVEEITALRFELKKASTDLKVVKNRMALRALDGVGDYSSIKPYFDHMTAVGLTYGDVSSGAKAITKYAKDNQKLKIRAGIVEGRVVSLAEVRALAALPSKNELLAKLLGTLVAVPTGFVRVLNGVPAKWVYLLQAIKEKKEKGG
jgi:large subunit ribosomal protein L10